MDDRPAEPTGKPKQFVRGTEALTQRAQLTEYFDQYLAPATMPIQKVDERIYLGNRFRANRRGIGLWRIGIVETAQAVLQIDGMQRVRDHPRRIFRRDDAV